MGTVPCLRFLGVSIVFISFVAFGAEDVQPPVPTPSGQPAVAPSPAPSTPQKPALTAPASAQERIDRHIALLRQESLQDSLNLLSEVEMFYWPGHGRDGAGTVILPLPQGIGSEFVDSVMNNRRFLKLLDELATIPKAEASALVAEQVRKTLPIYQRLFDESLSRLIANIPRAPANMARSSGLSVQTTNNPDHTPTLGGARGKLLALALIAGNLELKEARPAMLELARVAGEQRARFYQPHAILLKGDRHCILAVTSLYNRQMLATGLIGTSLETALKEVPDEYRPARWEKRRLPHYDERNTPYHLLSRPGGPSLVDSKGNAVDDAKRVLTVGFPAPLSDEQWDKVLAACAK